MSAWFWQGTTDSVLVIDTPPVDKGVILVEDYDFRRAGDTQSPNSASTHVFDEGKLGFVLDRMRGDIADGVFGSHADGDKLHAVSVV